MNSKTTTEMHRHSLTDLPRPALVPDVVVAFPMTGISRLDGYQQHQTTSLYSYRE